MSKKIFNDLSNICKVIDYNNEAEITKYSQDWRRRINFKALCVVFPKNENDISLILKYCFENNIKLIPQGGNTNLVASASPSREKNEVIISLEKINKIYEIDVINKCVELDAGVIVDDLNNQLNKKGFLFPLQMASTGSSQVGGVISTNAGGINVIHYGSVRSNLLALNVVLADGRIIKLGSKVIKDNTGYNLKDLFCGSEGTLGIISKATLKIYPQPKDNISFFASFEKLENVIKFYDNVSKDIKLPIVGFEIIPHLSFDLCVKHNFINKSFFNEKKNYYALVKIQVNNSEKNMLEFLEQKLSDLSDFYCDLIIAQNEQQNLDFWKFREDLTEAQKLEGKLIGFDISLPLNKIDYFFKEAKLKIDNLLKGVKFHTFGHLGDSNIHYNLIEPNNLEDDFYSYEKNLKKIINDLIKEISGSISAEHGIGLLKRDDFIETKSELEIELMKNIKKIFDPKNILNENKIFKN